MWLCMACLCPAVAVGAVELDCAYYAPDRGTPYAWAENAKDIQAWFTDSYRAAGLACLYVRNEGPRPISAIALSWGGRTFDDLHESHDLIWWRMLPYTLPPGGVGEVLVRPRAALSAPVVVTASFDDGSTLSATIAPEPNPLRITTIGFSEDMREVFLVAECLDRQERRAGRVQMDGKVADEARVLDPGSLCGACPIVLHVDEPLAYGSYHTFEVECEDGAVAAACVRAYGGWVPLGTYGYSQFELFAQNGCNGHNSFSAYSAGDLETLATLGMRGAMILGDRVPEAFMVGKPELFGLCPQDEPDVGDYFVEDVPMDLRPGALAMEMERRVRGYRETDPRTLTYITVDLTFKPANYFIYGPIADVLNPDCYPLMSDQDPRWVREVVETARHGAGPRPVTFTYQSGYIEPGDEETPTRRARPPFRGELRAMMHYAIGAGARGLWNYIHCTEGKSHGTTEFPDLWAAIGQTYRELGRIAPLIALAHPTQLATCEGPDMWVRTLLCGEDAIVLVCVNEAYESTAQSCTFHPRPETRVTLPRLPWFTPRAAWIAREGGLTAASIDGTTVTVPPFEDACVVVVSPDANLAKRLDARYDAWDTTVSRALLSLQRQRLRAQGDRAALVRRLLSEYADCVVMGSPVGAYGSPAPSYWNPVKEQYPAFEFGENAEVDSGPKGAEWRIEAAAAGARAVLYGMCGTWGRAGEWSVVGPDGEAVELTSHNGAFDAGTVLAIPVQFPTPGTYTVRFIQSGPGPVGGRVAHALFVVPGERLSGLPRSGTL